MLKIRLKKYGRKKRPSYRIVVIDSRKRRDGRPIEEIGFYNPLTNETTINLDKVNTYKQNGAQVSKIVLAICSKALTHS
uniref:Ribosomal protein S16 n=1 Tax=Acrochaetium secundatum TaxID=209631 RepID=A0A4D6BKQ1_9FLOR|nr:ribosomal protein S16 [Acrochaetium secundatum]QBX88360.1 ribosomal protein S16 [Acrochaetium secundatum]